MTIEIPETVYWHLKMFGSAKQHTPDNLATLILEAFFSELVNAAEQDLQEKLAPFLNKPATQLTSLHPAPSSD